MNSKKKQFLIFLLIVIPSVLLDQLTKLAALKYLTPYVPVPFIGHIFELNLIGNQGMAMGLLQGKKIYFAAAAILFSAFVLYVLYKMPLQKKYFRLLITISFLFAGAVGNLIDRLTREAVVDFIYFRPINFWIFNVADIYVTLSTIALVILFLNFYKEEDLNFIFGKEHS